MADFVNWQDYYGMNEPAAQAEANRLTDPLAERDAQLRRDVAGSARGAYQRGVSGQGGPDWQLRNATSNLMSYGDAVEALQNPATLQAAMEGSGHAKRQVSALDAAAAGQAGGEQFHAAQSRYGQTDAYARQTTEKAAQDYARGQADEAGIVRQRADAQVAADRAKQQQREKAAAWQHHLEDDELGRDRYKAGSWSTVAGQDRADRANLKDLYSGKKNLGTSSDRLRGLYRQGLQGTESLWGGITKGRY